MVESSEKLFARAQVVAPGGVHSPVRAFKSVGGSPIFFKSGKGSKLQSVEGQEYIDYCQSFGPLILGHRDPVVEKAVLEQISQAWTFGACEPYSLDLAERIVRQVPFVEKVRFVSSGTEAVMSALRVARAATKRPYVLKFDGCYHGHFDALLVKSGSGLAGEATSDSAGISEAMARETLVAPLDDDSALEDIFRIYGKSIAVVVLEPLPANYGLLIQRPEWIHKLVKLARDNGALVLMDEVISGFRIHEQGMSGVLEIQPDLVCYGKVLGGGFNVGAYAGKSQLMDLVAPMGPVYQAGTLSANPIGTVAGLKTLERIDDLGGIKTLNQKTTEWLQDLNKELKSTAFEVIHFGSCFWLKAKTTSPVRKVSEIPVEHKAQFAKIFHALIKRKIYFAPSGFEVGFVGFAHSTQDLAQTTKALVEVIRSEFPS